MRLRPVHAVSRVLWASPLLVACVGEQGNPVPDTHTVEIREMAFRPAELRVRAGDTIVWVNRDFVQHTATAPDSAWTSPPLARGERWRMVARGPGTSTYICAFHPAMEARLMVDSPPSAEE